jgi:hypothetical protein
MISIPGVSVRYRKMDIIEELKINITILLILFIILILLNTARILYYKVRWRKRVGKDRRSRIRKKFRIMINEENRMQEAQ